MSNTKKNNENNERIEQLETKVSDLKFQLEDVQNRLTQEQNQKWFYQLVADFTVGWELWFAPDQSIKYCSPSCIDITGYTANQIIASDSISELLVFSADKEKFQNFISQALDQMIINQSFEFRIVTRTRQLRWCSINVRGVYNTEGRYLGVRASIQDITKLKNAMGRITDLSEKKEIESRNTQRLSSELEMKERELVAFLLQLSQKNELIALLERHLNEAQKANTKQKQITIDKMLEIIGNTRISPVDWEMVNVQIEKIYPGFLQRLQTKHPRLTPNEKKLCASLRLGLTSKEIAGLNDITPQSVEVARVRLRKKLKLSGKIRLTNYLEQI